MAREPLRNRWRLFCIPLSVKHQVKPAPPPHHQSDGDAIEVFQDPLDHQHPTLGPIHVKPTIVTSLIYVINGHLDDHARAAATFTCVMQMQSEAIAGGELLIMHHPHPHPPCSCHAAPPCIPTPRHVIHNGDMHVSTGTGLHFRRATNEACVTKHRLLKTFFEFLIAARFHYGECLLLTKHFHGGELHRGGAWISLIVWKIESSLIWLVS